MGDILILRFGGLYNSIHEAIIKCDWINIRIFS